MKVLACHLWFIIQLMEEILHNLRLVAYPPLLNPRVFYIQTVVGKRISEPSTGNHDPYDLGKLNLQILASWSDRLLRGLTMRVHVTLPETWKRWDFFWKFGWVFYGSISCFCWFVGWFGWFWKLKKNIILSWINPSPKCFHGKNDGMSPFQNIFQSPGFNEKNTMSKRVSEIVRHGQAKKWSFRGTFVDGSNFLWTLLFGACGWKSQFLHWQILLF